MGLLDYMAPTPSKYGKRADGSEKGDGYFGAVKRPDGNVSTELSIGVNLGGKEVEIPTMVPTLSAEELRLLMSAPDGQMPPETIVQKAVDFAKQRQLQGLPYFAAPGEQAVPLPTGYGATPGLLNSLGR